MWLPERDSEWHRKGTQILLRYMMWFNGVTFAVVSFFFAIDKVGSVRVNLEMMKRSDLIEKKGKTYESSQGWAFWPWTKNDPGMMIKCPEKNQGNYMWAFNHIPCSIIGSFLRAMVPKMERRAVKPGPIGATQQVILNGGWPPCVVPWVTQWQQVPLKGTSITSEI